MIKLERNNNTSFTRYMIKTDTGKIDIRFQDNYDLYWYFIPTIKSDKNIIYITKENYFLYSLISDLYNHIKNNNPYTYPCCEEVKLSFIPTNSPFENNKIVWYSDDFKDENQNVLIIENIDDIYKIEFIRNDGELGKVIPIRISNSESKYYPFSNVFMSMYRSLENYNYDYHQIELEEYLYTLSME